MAYEKKNEKRGRIEVEKKNILLVEGKDEEIFLISCLSLCL